MTDATSGGMVLPIAWNMLAFTKIIPDATKFHEMIRRYSEPTATTAGSCEKKLIIGSAAIWQARVNSAITPAAMSAAR